MPAATVVQNWQTYALDLEGRMAVRMVNLGLRVQAPMPGLGHLLTAWVKVPRNDDSGQPTEREQRILARIDELLEREVMQRYNGLYVGHQTRNGVREFFYYCLHAEGHQQVVSQIVSAFEGYAHGSIARPDAEWSHYLSTLYPDPATELSIRNQNTVESLSFFGDPLVPPRQIDHFLYFATETGRAQFLAQAAEMGFNVLRTTTYADGERMPFSVLLARNDSAELNHIDLVVHQLANLAKQYGGEYDGWESALVESPDALSGLAGNLLNKLGGQS